MVMHILLEEVDDPHVHASSCCPCMLEKPLLQSDLDSFLLREIQNTLLPCAPYLLLCALASRPTISSATLKGSICIINPAGLMIQIPCKTQVKPENPHLIMSNWL